MFDSHLRAKYQMQQKRDHIKEGSGLPGVATISTGKS
jgi:hypothetical protein